MVLQPFPIVGCPGVGLVRRHRSNHPEINWNLNGHRRPIRIDSLPMPSIDYVPIDVQQDREEVPEVTQLCDALPD